MISLMHVDPRVKLGMMLAVSASALAVRGLLPLLAILVLNLLILLLGGIRISQSFSRVQLFVKTILAVFVLQLLFNRSGDPILTAGAVTLLTDQGLANASAVSLRLLIILTAALMVRTGDAHEYLQALIQLRIPCEIALMTMAALRLLPILKEAFLDAANAMQMRGVRLKKQNLHNTLAAYGRLFMPVVAEAIHRSEQMAIAMEARAFRSLPRRTSMDQMTMHKKDWGVLGATLTALAAILVLSGG